MVVVNALGLDDENYYAFLVAIHRICFCEL